MSRKQKKKEQKLQQNENCKEGTIAVEESQEEVSDSIETISEEMSDSMKTENVAVDSIKSDVNHQPRYHYEITFLHEDKQGELHRIHIEMKHFRLLFGTVLGIFILVCCILGYRQYRASNQLNEALLVVNSLKVQLADERLLNEEAQIQIDELNSSMQIMGDSLLAKTEALSSYEAEIAGRCIPEAYPLKGSAAITNASTIVSDNTASENASSQEKAVHFIADSGSSVVATADGVISQVTTDDQYGICIVVDHENGYQTVYRGKGVVLVGEGTRVSTGTVMMQIAEDNSEFVYQILLFDEYIDPMECMEING